MSATEKKHAKASPSSAHRWIPCPGSIMLSEGIPNTTSEYAEYGTAGHELGETCLREDKQAKDFKGQYLNKTENYPDGFLVDDEMIEAVQQYIDYCRSLEGQHNFIEHRVDYSRWVEDGFGTSDFINVQDETEHRVLYNADLKMGKGVKVYAKENPQGIIYTGGVIDALNPIFEFERDDKVIVSIVQPRLDHIDEWETTVGWIIDYMDNIVAPAAKKALEGVPEFHPGEKQCRFCPAKSTCKALAHHGLETAMLVFNEIPTEEIQLKEVHQMSVEEIAQLLPMTNTIVDWAKSLHGYAKELLESGVAVPGYKLVRGRPGNRAWINEEDVERTLKNMRVKKGDMFTKKILSPPQMCKMIKNLGVKPEKIEHLWSQPEGSITLAPEADSREEVILDCTDQFGEIP